MSGRMRIRDGNVGRSRTGMSQPARLALQRQDKLPLAADGQCAGIERDPPQQECQYTAGLTGVGEHERDRSTGDRLALQILVLFRPRQGQIARHHAVGWIDQTGPRELVGKLIRNQSVVDRQLKVKETAQLADQADFGQVAEEIRLRDVGCGRRRGPGLSPGDRFGLDGD